MLCIRVVFFLFCGFRKNTFNTSTRVLIFFAFLGRLNKANAIRGHKQGFCFYFFGAAKKANLIKGHKGCVFGALRKINPIGGYKGCVFAFFWASKKVNPIGEPKKQI